MLKLHSDAITVPVKKYLSEFAECDDTNKISEEDKLLIEELPYENVCFDETQLPVLLYVAGYAAKKITAKIHCLGCKHMVIDESGELLQVDIDKSIILYFAELNRGGLIYPSSTVLQAFSNRSCNFYHLHFRRLSKNFFKNTISEKISFSCYFSLLGTAAPEAGAGGAIAFLPFNILKTRGQRGQIVLFKISIQNNICKITKTTVTHSTVIKAK